MDPGQPSMGPVNRDRRGPGGPRQDARAHLRRADPVLARLIDVRPDFEPRGWMAELPAMDLFGALVFQVTGQQLSVASTRRILARIQALSGGHLPSPEELLRADPAELRRAGLSGRKVATLRDLAERATGGRLNLAELSARPDEEIIAQLTVIPGIGPWTVQGALLIALQRPDVIRTDDLALRHSIQARYGLDHLPDPAEVADLARPWRPYRSLASSLLLAAARSS